MSEEVKDTTGEKNAIPEQPGIECAGMSPEGSTGKSADTQEEKTSDTSKERASDLPESRAPEKPAGANFDEPGSPAAKDPDHPEALTEENAEGPDAPAAKESDNPKEPPRKSAGSPKAPAAKDLDSPEVPEERKIPATPKKTESEKAAGDTPDKITEANIEATRTPDTEKQKVSEKGKTGVSKQDPSLENAEERETRAGKRNLRNREEEYPAGGEESDSEDEDFFEEDEEDGEIGDRGFHFRFRFPKIRIRTKKIAEQEKARMLAEEAAPSGDEPAAEDGNGSSDSSREEEKIIWIPAGLAAVIIIVAAVVVSALAAIFGTIYWKYRGYEVVDSRKQEDTLSASYCSAGDNILRYSTDGASLISRSGTVLWDVSYTMNDPEVALCGDIMAVYDKDGTNIVVCNAAGEIGSMSTSLPIVRAKVCETGAVAALMQDSSNVYVEYYDSKGEQIAMIKTSMDNPGYPLDIALSNDGQNIAVSYLSYDDSGQKAIVRFYNFGTAGQNQMDNRIADFQYSNVIIPQLEFLDSQTCVAFRTDGFSVYSGESSVKETATVSTDQKIKSVFHDSSRIGMIVNDTSSGSFDLLVYNTAGRQLLNRAFDFAYRSVEFTGDEISLYSGAKICVFNMYGVEKFNGSYNGSPQDIFSIGKHRYVVVKENSLDMIRLK